MIKMEQQLDYTYECYKQDRQNKEEEEDGVFLTIHGEVGEPVKIFQKFYSYADMNNDNEYDLMFQACIGKKNFSIMSKTWLYKYKNFNHRVNKDRLK